MARYRTSVRTPWPPTKAFAYMSDLSKFSEWDPGIKESRLVSGSPGAVGSTYDLTLGGIRDTVMRYEIADTDGRSTVEAHSTTSMLTSVDRVSIAPDVDGSLVTYDADVRLRGIFGLANPIFGLLFRRIGDRAADGLRDRAGTLVEPPAEGR